MDPITLFRLKFRALALVCTAGSVVLTWKFGIVQSVDREIGIAIAVVLCCFSLASDYIWLFVREAWRKRQIGTACAYALGGAALFALNCGTNLGSVGWQRDSIAAETARLDVQHTTARSQATMSADRRAMLESLVTDLRAMHPWAATITADALRRQIEATKRNAAREAANIRCSAKCRALEREVADLERQLGVVEQRESYEQQIATIEHALAQQTDRVLATDDQRIVSAPVAQAALFASLSSQSLEPTSEAQAWMLRIVASAIAVGLVIAPGLFGLIGFAGVAPSAPARTEDHDAQTLAPVARGPVPGHTTTEATPLVPVVVPPARGSGDSVAVAPTIVHQRLTDARFAKAAAALLAPYRQRREQTALAA